MGTMGLFWRSSETGLSTGNRVFPDDDKSYQELARGLEVNSAKALPRGRSPEHRRALWLIPASSRLALGWRCIDSVALCLDQLWVDVDNSGEGLYGNFDPA